MSRSDEMVDKTNKNKTNYQCFTKGLDCPSDIAKIFFAAGRQVQREQNCIKENKKILCNRYYWCLIRGWKGEMAGRTEKMACRTFHRLSTKDINMHTTST